MKKRRTSAECFARVRRTAARREERELRALVQKERARALDFVADQLEEERLPRELREVARKVIDKLRAYAASSRA